MKVLTISDEVWNDVIHGNNVMTNWFEGMCDVEIANIFCSPGQPQNNCCQSYFQLTDAEMFKSIFTREKAGRVVTIKGDVHTGSNQAEDINAEFYSFMKKITTESLRALREWIWVHGKYNLEELKKFIQQFQPDVVFSIRYASRKILRLERVVNTLTDAPMIAFTGDDEYSLRQIRITPVYWVRRLLLRRDLRKNMGIYRKYLFLSEEQRQEYEKLFQIKGECIYKNGEFSEEYIAKNIHKPIKLIYAGKLYCNRWKVLAAIGRALRKINKLEVKMVLDIYTKDKISRRQYTQLHDGMNICLKGAVSASELKEIYSDADIALHVESFDLVNRLSTRYSFSTKIIDCLVSGCAVMAICWEHHSGYTYLERQDAAICIKDKGDIEKVLSGIAEKPEVIQLYSKKAWECGKRNHQRVTQQQRMYEIFNEVIAMGDD